MRVLGVVGWSGSGKTTLLVSLLPLLRAHGLTVSTVKHVHHGFDMDRPGKDSHRHREAGAHEVMVAAGSRWVLLHEVVGREPPLPDLLDRMAPVDLVLVEGFKTHPFPKLEVHRPALGKPALWPTDPNVIAVASDAEPDTGDRTRLALNDPAAVVAWILGRMRDLPHGLPHGPGGQNPGTTQSGTTKAGTTRAGTTKAGTTKAGTTRAGQRGPKA